MSWDTWLLGADVHLVWLQANWSQVHWAQCFHLWVMGMNISKCSLNLMLDHFLGIDVAGLWQYKCSLPLKRECVAIFFIPSCPPFRYWHLQDSLVVRTTYHPTTPILRLLNLHKKHLLLVTWRSLIPFYGQFTTCMKRLIQLAAMTALNYSNCATK